MVRNRSRSTSRDGRSKKDKERERDKDRNRHSRHSGKTSSKRSRTKSRSRSPRGHHRSNKSERTKSRSPSPYLTLGGGTSKSVKAQSNVMVLDPQVMEGKSNEEIEMLKIMGFSGFDTTKGKHVEGTNHSAINIQQKRKYRQYMNRKGGFNRKSFSKKFLSR
jgi:U4/U6.U5 tri-snRNP-associated protein 3